MRRLPATAADLGPSPPVEPWSVFHFCSIMPIVMTPHEVRAAARQQTVGYMTAALSLVAGLAWNDAIAALIKELFPAATSGIWAKFAYALLVTGFVVIATMLVQRAFAEKK